MPPIDSKRTNDGPACRVCGCTQHNACPPTCSWVPTGELDEPRSLCSACAGMPADMLNTIGRIRDLLAHQHGKKANDRVLAITNSAELRFRARSRYDSGDTITTTEAAAIGAL